MNENRFIQDYLLKLTNGNKFARNLEDDVSNIEEYIVNTDTSIEGIHIVPNLPVNFIAYKAMARSFSDIFAKCDACSKLIGYFLNIILPKDFNQFTQLTQGFDDFARKYNVDLLGGDTSVHHSKNIIIVVTVIANISKTRQTPQRNAAKIGDNIFITKNIGEAFLGYKKINGKFLNFDDDSVIEYLTPTLVQIEDFSKINASMDISDGLIQDANKMASVSRCHFEIDFNLLPFARGITTEMLSVGLSFGDDYNILCTSKEETIPNCTKIGIVTDGIGVELINSPFEVNIQGFDHFS